MIEQYLIRVNEIYGVYINMNIAYMMFGSKMNEMLPDNSKSIHFGDGDPNDPKTKADFSINIGEFKEKIKKDGHDTKLITNLCLVAIYQLWEDEYREKIAVEKGLAKNDLLVDILGDIRILRMAIIHNNSQKISKFQNFKVLKFMKKRESVSLDNSEFRIIIDLLREQLYAI